MNPSDGITVCQLKMFVKHDAGMINRRQAVQQRTQSRLFAVGFTQVQPLHAGLEKSRQDFPFAGEKMGSCNNNQFHSGIFMSGTG